MVPNHSHGALSCPTVGEGTTTIQVIGRVFVVDIREDKNFSLSIRMFAALAFSPPEHTESWFKTLQLSLPEFEARDFVDYFEEVYLGRLNRNGIRRKPRFHLTMWNVYHRLSTYRGPTTL